MGTGWDDRQERTRAEVLQAAREIIAAGGVETLSMRRLAERAGVAVGTLYNQFGDRDGILVALVSNGLDGLEQSLDAAPASEPLHATRMLFAGLDATIAESVEVWRPVFAVIRATPDHVGLGAVGDRFEKLIENDLAKAAAEGLFRVDIDVERLAWHVFMMRISRLERWSVGALTWDEYIESSYLGLEISLAAVLVEPYATEALARSGLVR